MNFGGFLHSELVMRIRGDLVVHKPTTAIVYNGLGMACNFTDLKHKIK